MNGTGGRRVEGVEDWDAEALSPNTAAERREQARLFRQLEAYWTDRTSQRGRYHVQLTEYTAEGLKDFFAYLHLGPRQRALLLGRAPLVAGTSLVGGTLHQDPPAAHTPARGTQQHGSGSGSGGGAAAPRPVAPAPVKLFTLTTETSLEGVLRESYESYINDKAFSKSNKARAGAAPMLSASLSHPPTTSSQSQPPRLLPLVSKPNGPREKGSTAPAMRREPIRPPVAASTHTAVAAAAAAAAASSIPPPPPPLPRNRKLPAKQLPAVAEPAARRTREPSFASSTSSLPKLYHARAATAAPPCQKTTQPTTATSNKLPDRPPASE